MVRGLAKKSTDLIAAVAVNQKPRTNLSAVFRCPCGARLHKPARGPSPVFCSDRCRKAVARAKAKPSKVKRGRINSTYTMEERGDDFYATPACAVQALMKIEKLPKVICDPCVGDGAIVDVLAAAGHVVSGLDIKDRGWPGTVIADYLPAPGPFGAIVTNPPYKLAFEFIQKAVADGCPYIAFLLRTNFLEGQKRKPFFEKHPPTRVWIASARLPMMHRGGWTGRKAGSNATYAWFVWQAGAPRRPVNWFNWKELLEPKKWVSEAGIGDDRRVQKNLGLFD